MRTKINQAVMFVGLLVIGLVVIFPFVWRVLSAFKTPAEINSLDQTLFPKEWTLSNFTGIQERVDFFRLFGNSVFLAVTITTLSIYTSTIAGFVLSKYQFRGRALRVHFGNHDDSVGGHHYSALHDF